MYIKLFTEVLLGSDVSVLIVFDYRKEIKHTQYGLKLKCIVLH